MCEKPVQMQIQCTNKSDVFGIILNSSNLQKREQDQKMKVAILFIVSFLQLFLTNQTARHVSSTLL